MMIAVVVATVATVVVMTVVARALELRLASRVAFPIGMSYEFRRKMVATAKARATRDNMTRRVGATMSSMRPECFEAPPVAMTAAVSAAMTAV